ncbi:hypothetical protein D044_3887B, partial [Vibrio parahaemolyticus EKP-026]
GSASPKAFAVFAAS